MDQFRNLQQLAALLLGSVLVLAGCASHQNAPDGQISVVTTPFSVERNLRFSPADWPQALFADLYLPDRSSPPVVLLVHGGGWERRSRDDMTWIAEELASHGFAVMNIDYRFAPDYTFPAQLHDLQLARAWLNRNADRYQLDASSVSGFGFSSGAHLVTLLAVVASSDSNLNQPFGGPDTRLNAVVAGGLPADLTAFDSGPLLRQFLGGPEQEIPQVYRDASPITHVTDETPPVFLFHGGMDGLVPFSQAEQFQAALAAHEVDNELYKMHFRGHITSFLTAGDAVAEAIQFLVRQGKSNGGGVNRSEERAGG
ncbi:alpha/beta hydrolase [Marinobacter arenosus]|uniref:alpha/beta hydrolase n=1 Tax=Marinobacter arenosus TaxID=2856822 RepID=UPI001C4D8D3A|nr:alpha/beta hydrolase [Marinobacter arenosus]MBW0148177.1 alpha/beta hydrolase [Marinobacter arenosus]